MPDARRRRGRVGNRPGPPAARSRVSTTPIILVPTLIAVILNIPSLGLGYFWDDYYFLASRGEGGFRNYLLPDPHTAFYRPIPQGVFFGFLHLVDPSNGIVGHLVNLAVLATAIALLVLLVSRLCGARAGLFSGIIFASFGHVPSLVAWVSASQDLFAIAFVIAAFYLRHQGKHVPALACATAAVLCKEPAIAAFPVLVFWDWIVGRPTARLRIQLVAYGLVLGAWLAIHPGIHLLAGRGFRTGATSYVGLEHPERWGRYLVRYLMTLLNLPPLRLSVSWWEDRANYGFAALVVLAAGLPYLDRRLRSDSEANRSRFRSVGMIAALFAIPTILMPTILIRHWAPYFACIPALGAAILLGPLIARLRKMPALVVLSAFLLLGIWTRGVYAREEPVWSEVVLAEAADAVKEVRANFHKVLPSIPKGSQVVVSVGTTGARGIHSTLIDTQALQAWYRDPTLRTVSTLKRQPGAASELLVRVTTELDVISIDPDTHRVRASMGREPDFGEINRPLNNYARAVAAGGEADRAVRILEGLARLEPGASAAYDHRMIASIFLAAGRQSEADSLMAITPSFPRGDALTIMKRLLGEATPNERLDNAAFAAFGLSASDPETIRWLMREFRKDGSLAQAAWYAQKLQELAPGDAESSSLLTSAARAGVKPQREPA